MQRRNWIAHRGNIEGPDQDRENHPEYIQLAIEKGFDVEVDIWYIKNGEWWLGHDKPQYRIDFDFLKTRNTFLWVHTKNIESCLYLKQYNDDKRNNNEQTQCIHTFDHTTEPFVFTSKGIKWVYPGQPILAVGDVDTICVLPEITPTTYTENELKNCKGICSDYIDQYRNRFESKPF